MFDAGNDKNKIRATKIVELDVVSAHTSLFRWGVVLIRSIGVAVGITLVRRSRRA